MAKHTLTTRQLKALIRLAQVKAEEATRRKLMGAVVPIVEKDWSGNTVVDAFKATAVEHEEPAEILRLSI